MRVTSRRTTASGPPVRASSTPASTSAVRTVPRGRGPRREDRSLGQMLDSASTVATTQLWWTASTNPYIVDSVHIKGGLAMTTVLDGVRDHYRATGLTERLKAALSAFGPEDQRLTPEQL